MNTFNLSAPVYLVNPYSNVDSRYGPWTSVADANSNIDLNVRAIELTVGVSAIGIGVIEYWYKNGIQNNNLIIKSDEAIVLPLSASWNSNFNTVCALSAKWNTPYDTTLNVNSTNAVENSAIAVKIQSIENNLNILVPPPTYILPQATLTNFSELNQIYEVGANINQIISLGFVQNDAGSPQLYRLERNNFFIGQQTFPFNYNVNEIVVQGTTTYRNTVTYVAGLIKNNILGVPDNRGQILAGTVSIERSYTGRYRQFFGSVSAIPTNLRTLTGNNFDNTNSFTFYAHQVNNILAIPATKSLQSAVTQNNETVTENFLLSSTTVNNANGVPVSYKRYVQTTDVPFNVNITFTLTTP